ncbi:hypothetical protein ACF0H5_019035 [Mactra antiquata]
MMDYSIRDQVAVIKLDNPPVNVLGSAALTSIYDGIGKADRDPSIKAVVICGKNGIFCAGVDIKELDNGLHAPWIKHIGDFIDNMKKPVVAAIEGFALGGGLELALFCHYRIALKTVRVSLPELQLGLMPGAGGTIRLPRAAGLNNAFDIITTGNRIPAEKAAMMGIIDQIVTGDIIEEGIKFVKSKCNIDTSLVCLRMKTVKYSGDLDDISEAFMTKVKSKFKGAIAPIVSILEFVIIILDLYYVHLQSLSKNSPTYTRAKGTCK